MPTAIPDDPLTSRFGRRAGSTVAPGPTVEVVHEIDRAPVDVRQHLVADGGQPRLGVPIGRRRVAVDGAEVALAVDQG